MEDLVKYCERCGVKEESHENVYKGAHEFIEARPLQVGDILDSSWGYDQTNVDFYKVVKRTKTMVTLVKIGAYRDRETSRFGNDAMLPDVSRIISEPFRRKTHSYRGGERVTLTSYSGASRWVGELLYETASEFGH